MITSDKRILRFIDLLVFEKKIENPSEFCDHIGLARQNLSKIKNGKQHFTQRHIENVCRIWDVNANWIFGTQNKVYNSPESIEITDFPSESKSSIRKSNHKVKK